MSKDSFHIKGLAGKKTLAGEIPVSGAKNAALKLMAASVLFTDELSLANVPAIEDVGRMAELIEELGGAVERDGQTCLIRTVSLEARPALSGDIAKRLRASVVLTGPLLARFREVSFPHPGGDVIGARPINFFLESFRKMAASVEEQSGSYRVSAPQGLRGADIFFPWISVTATETLMMAAVLAQGTTTLRNCAMEPEVGDLASFLNECGAQIRGMGTPTLVIEGTEMLEARGRSHRVIPDRVEAGSFVILGVLAGKEITVTKCEPEHLRMLIELLKEAGADITVSDDAIVVRDSGAPLKPIHIRTHEYPGFATDLQAPMMVFLTQARGESTVFETVFEGRLNYAEDLRRMGADITVWNPHQASVKGPTPLRAAKLESPDIRAGLAFLMAALIADGESVLDNVYHIDRGYEHIEQRLQAIGAGIERVHNG
jgi:UDP-N-acetylglucosamine 1-carboxyvinyltransferase